jgi:hypothetical protein
MEFRCFVSKGRLTAISQYHHLCFFQRLVDMRDHVLKLISTFFNDHLKAALSPKFQDYIIDMGVLMRNGSFDDGEVLVIELNPFMETTDACCFDWKNDFDIISGSSNNPHDDHNSSATNDDDDDERSAIAFRIRDRELKGSKAMMYDSWREIFDRLRCSSSSLGS